VRAEVWLERVGVTEVLSTQHARIRERIVVNPTMSFVVAVVRKRWVTVCASIRTLTRVHALMRLHALQMIERRAAEVTEESPRRHAAQQMTT